jgi:Polyphosphate kinase
MSKASFSENANISNQLINRELSWLQFNDRVLEESKDETNPLFERVKFLSIAGTNLDEFFMVRVAGLFNQIKDGFDEPSADGLTAEDQLNRVVVKTKDLLKKQNEAFLELKKELSKEKIFIRKISELNKKDLIYLREYFQETIYPIITPTAIDPSHPFPFIPNKGQAILLRMTRIKKKRELNAIIVIPRALPKFISLNNSETINEFVTIDDVICKFANEIFPDHYIEASLQFKIIRDQ